MLRLLTLGTLCIYWLAIFWGTHVPSDMIDAPRVNDKVLHVGAYAGLAFLLAATLTAWGVKRGALLISLAVAGIYGGVDELTQMLVRGRSATFSDWTADMVGAVVGVIAFAIGLSLISGSDWMQRQRG